MKQQPRLLLGPRHFEKKETNPTTTTTTISVKVFESFARGSHATLEQTSITRGTFFEARRLSAPSTECWLLLAQVLGLTK